MRKFWLPMAGATLHDRSLASLGAAFGICFTAAFCVLIPLPTETWPLLVAPIGASAVLIFAVPASPLAQPWPVIGGNVISAFIGVIFAHFVPVMPLAAGLAVGTSIILMSLLRCLHPPGGAAALTAVIGGPLVATAGYQFPLMPVAVNSLLLVVAGVLFHRIAGRAYPHVPKPAQVSPPHPEDLDMALDEIGETYDITREDLARIVQQVQDHAQKRLAKEAMAKRGSMFGLIKPR